MENVNLKLFLQNKLDECRVLIKKRKSIVGNSTVSVLSAVSVSLAVVSCLSAFNTITTTISIKFNLGDLGDLKSKISDNIRKLNIIKDKLDYVISCNGNLSKEESNAILYEFIKL